MKTSIGFNRHLELDWLVQTASWVANGFQGKEGQKVPDMTDNFVNEVSDRYIELYEKITGEKFIRTDITNVPERIEKNCMEFLKSL